MIRAGRPLRVSGWPDRREIAGLFARVPGIHCWDRPTGGGRRILRHAPKSLKFLRVSWSFFSVVCPLRMHGAFSRLLGLRRRRGSRPASLISDGS